MKRLKFTIEGKHPLLHLVRDLLILQGFELDQWDPDFLVLGGFGDVADLDPPHWPPYAFIPVLCLSSGLLFESSNQKKPVEESRPPSIFPLGAGALDCWKLLGNEIWTAEHSRFMILRIFDVYGHGAPETRLSDLLEKEQETLPDVTRSYLHIDDFKEVVLLLLHSLLMRKVNGIYNIGSDIPVDNRGLRFAAKATPTHTHRLKHWTAPFLVPDLTRTKAVTHWEPRVTLKSGLADYKKKYKEI